MIATLGARERCGRAWLAHNGCCKPGQGASLAAIAVAASFCTPAAPPRGTHEDSLALGRKRWRAGLCRPVCSLGRPPRRRMADGAIALAPISGPTRSELRRALARGAAALHRCNRANAHLKCAPRNRPACPQRCWWLLAFGPPTMCLVSLLRARWECAFRRRGTVGAVRSGVAKPLLSGGRRSNAPLRPGEGAPRRRGAGGRHTSRGGLVLPTRARAAPRREAKAGPHGRRPSSLAPRPTAAGICTVASGGEPSASRRVACLLWLGCVSGPCFRLPSDPLLERRFPRSSRALSRFAEASTRFLAGACQQER